MDSKSNTSVVSFLQGKNRCLQRVLELCAKFSREWETQDSTREQKLEALQRFQDRRNALFTALELYDRKIVEALALLPVGDLEHGSAELIEQTRIALQAKEKLIQALIERDNEIMVRINDEKARILEDLVEARRGQSVVNKFKSSWVSESGEGLDQKL